MDRVLITGAAGGIGRSLRESLLGVYRVLRLSDRVPLAPARTGEEVVLSELYDMAAVERMVDGVDGIVHLGGISGESEWEAILQSNVVGTYNLFEAARRAGVKRIIVATSNHAVGFYPRDQKIDHPGEPRPGQPLWRRQGLRRGALPVSIADKHGIGFSVRASAISGRNRSSKRRLSIWIQPARLYRSSCASASSIPTSATDRPAFQQPALMVRQLKRRAARLPTAGRFGTLCRGGARRRSRAAGRPDCRALPGRHVLRR